MNPYKILNVKMSDDLRTVQSAFYKLAMQHHPDCGGDPEIMKSLNEAWEWMRANHGTYQKEDREHVKYDINEDILNLAVEVSNKNPSLDVVIAGAWIWITGDKSKFTKDFRSYLKSLNFRYAPKKQAWYFSGCRSYSRGKYSLDQIYQAYGRYDLNHETRPKALSHSYS